MLLGLKSSGREKRGRVMCYLNKGDGLRKGRNESTERGVVYTINTSL